MRHCLRVFCGLYLGHPTDSTKAANSSHGGYCLTRPKSRTAWEELIDLLFRQLYWEVLLRIDFSLISEFFIPRKLSPVCCSYMSGIERICFYFRKGSKFLWFAFGTRQANLVLIAYASSEGSGEPAHSRSLHCSLIQAVSQEEPSDRKIDPWPLWMAGHAQLKIVITECS